MALTQLAPPYPIFTDKNGDPLDAGFLYFGEPNLNPETQPIQVYYDSAFTQPAAQPLRTSNGYVMRNGSPALIYADSQFSVTVRDKNNALVIYSPVGYGFTPGTAASFTDQITYNEGSAGAVDRVLTSRLQDSVSVHDFGAVGDGVADDTAAIQAALDTENVVFVPAGEYRVTDSIVINSNKSLVMLRGSQITGDMGTPKPVIRLIANFASLYGFGLPIVKADHQTGGLPSSINEGIINVGPATLGVGANINWAMIDGIRVMGNQSLYPQYVAATNTDIDKYIGIKMVHGRYLQPGAQSTSLYNSTVQNCMIENVGCGFDMDPVVQGNNFINNYFFNISFAGYRMRGCGENSFSHGFFHGSVGTTFFRMESTPLRVDGISGTFVGGETVTGGTSGATVVLYSGFPVDETEGALYGTFTGQFEPGETVTGGTSGATATVSTTRQIYYEGALGRTSLGNICQNIIGEPGATAFIGTQNAGPIGGRHARFYVALDGCSGNMYEGRGNTGHSVLDFDGNNALTEQGTIISPGRNASFDEISATTSVDVGTTTGSAYVNTGSTDAFQHHTDKAALSRTYTYGNGSIAVGEKERFSFLMGGNNVSALIRISVVNDWGGSSTDNRHRAAEYICRVFTNNFNGNSSIEGPTVVFEFGFAFATDFIFTSGSGDRTFTIDIANPNTDAGSVVQTAYHIDVLSRNCTLQSATVV
jgi:hypothetical protein